MAGEIELHNFVRKFVSLWQSGCDASLHVESREGNAVVNLQLDLGQAQSHPGVGQDAGGRRSGGPARQRRKERRDAERQVRATAEKDAAAEGVHDERRQEARCKLAAEEAVQMTEKVRQVAKEAFDKEANQAYSNENVKAENEANRKLKTVQITESDGDIYDYKIFDESKKMEAQETLDIIEERIQKNFLGYQVEKCDQVYKIGLIVQIEKKEIDSAEGFWKIHLSD